MQVPLTTFCFFFLTFPFFSLAEISIGQHTCVTTKRSEEYFFHQRCKETSTNFEMDS